MSCPSASFLRAGTNDGYVTTFDGASWTTPALADPPLRQYSDSIEQISCSSDNLCMAALVRPYGEQTMVRYQAGTWYPPATPFRYPDRVSVSCPTDTFCLAVNGDEYATYDGSTWQTLRQPQYWLRLVSCASPTFCVGSSGYSSVRYYDGSTWSDPTPMPDGNKFLDCRASRPPSARSTTTTV